MNTLELPADLEAEAQTLGSVMIDPDTLPEVRRILQPSDFFRQSNAWIYEAQCKLYDANLPIDNTLLMDELKGKDISSSELSDLMMGTPTAIYADHYAALVKRQSRLRQQLKTVEKAAEIVFDTGDPDQVDSYLREQVGAASTASDALLTWEDSFDLRSQLRRMYATPEHKAALERWTYPWPSWNRAIDPAEPGIPMTIMAADGVGKTIAGECLAEHWARKGNAVIYVHFELSRKIMMERSMARNASIPRHNIITNQLTPVQRRTLEEVDNYMLGWPGRVEYLNVPGKSMEHVVAEASAATKRLKQQGYDVAVVVDYLEKAEASTRQLKLFGSNVTSREANDVNQLKNFSECEEVRMVMLSQLNKEGKTIPFESLTRSAVRGAGQKTEFCNVVIILHKEILKDGLAAPGGKDWIVEPGGYAREMNVIIDKNTLGKTGRWRGLHMTNACFNMQDAENQR